MNLVAELVRKIWLLVRRTKVIRLLSLLLLMTLPTMGQAEDGVSLIAHKSAAVAELPQATLRAIFSMRIRQWPNGEPVRVYVLPDRHELHKTFSKTILNIYPYVLRDTWDRIVFTGTGKAPIEVDTAAELVQQVADTPGAIGYTHQELTSYDTIQYIELR